MFEDDDKSSDSDVSIVNENHEVNIFNQNNTLSDDDDRSLETAMVFDITPDSNVSNSSLVPYSDTENEELTPMKSKKLTRKRNPQDWKKNVRKLKRQRGEE